MLSHERIQEPHERIREAARVKAKIKYPHQRKIKKNRPLLIAVENQQNTPSMARRRALFLPFGGQVFCASFQGN